MTAANLTPGPHVVDLAEVVVGERDRVDLGDVDALAASIADVGLLHPVVVSSARVLIAGGRRLEAVTRLGWSSVPVTVADLATVEEVLRGEEQENTCRKPLTPVEGGRARRRREPTYAEMAREEQVRSGREHGRGQVGPPKLGGPTDDRRTAKLAAVGTGYSGTTLDKVDVIADAAEAPTVRYGGRKVAVPEPVRSVAREAYAAVSEPGARVDAQHRRVEAALAEHAPDDSYRAAMWRKGFYRALSRTTEVLIYTPSDIALMADDAQRQLLREHADLVRTLVDDVEAHRPALRSVSPLATKALHRAGATVDDPRPQVGSALEGGQAVPEPAREPAPSGRRRRPLPDAFRDAEYDLGKAVERLARLVADDRFPGHRRSRGRLGTGFLARHLRTLTEVVDAVTTPATVRDAPQDRER